MPQGETFWNPYRWVKVKTDPPQLQAPNFHHNFVGCRGYARCVLEALTPLFIGGGMKTDVTLQELHFLKSPHTKSYFIPGTSLKGMIRALYELLSNSAVPFDGAYADENHQKRNASDGGNPPGRLDPASKVFGFLDKGAVFRGLVRFSDAHPMGEVKEIGPFKVVVGQPKPDSHQPFYPNQLRRKFYHHHPAAKERLVPAPPEIKQTRTVYPLPSGSQFTFRMDFENLEPAELDLLLYCLVLEPDVSVTLTPEALGPQFKTPVTFRGPMAHKLGGCKPQGAGSVRITIAELTLFPNPAGRYRGQGDPSRTYRDQALKEYLDTRIAMTRQRLRQTLGDDILQDLYAMMIFSPDDPRKDIRYPDWNWFRSMKGRTAPLKPTH